MLFTSMLRQPCCAHPLIPIRQSPEVLHLRNGIGSCVKSPVSVCDTNLLDPSWVVVVSSHLPCQSSNDAKLQVWAGTSTAAREEGPQCLSLYDHSRVYCQHPTEAQNRPCSSHDERMSARADIQCLSIRQPSPKRCRASCQRTTSRPWDVGGCRMRSMPCTSLLTICRKKYAFENRCLWL